MIIDMIIVLSSQQLMHPVLFLVSPLIWLSSFFVLAAMSSRLGDLGGVGLPKLLMVIRRELPRTGPERNGIETA